MIHTNLLKNEIDSKHLLPGTGSCINSETSKIPHKGAKENKKASNLFFFLNQKAVSDFNFQNSFIAKCVKMLQITE